MGKLYELIKKEINSLNKYLILEKHDYANAKTFPKVIKANSEARRINSLISIINYGSEKYFGSKEAYKEFLAENDSIFFEENTKSIPYIETADHKYKKMIDYESLFDNLEEKIGVDNVSSLIDEFEDNLNKKYDNFLKPLKPFTEEIKNDLNNLFQDQELIEKYQSNLDFVSDKIIQKKQPGSVEKLIDDVSVGRDKTAIEKLGEFGQNNGLDPEEFANMNSDSSILEILPTSKERIDILKPLGLNKINYTDEYKQKILDFDAKIREIGIPTKFSFGEEGDKFYGLIDFAKKSIEINKLVTKYNTLNNEDEKREYIRQISVKRTELEEIESKYDEIFKYIKDNFDLDKISLPGNVYSGRVHDFNPEHPDSFIPNLIEKWDNENAAYAVFLSGFCQLRGAAEYSGVSLEEYINHPIESYLKGGMKYVEGLDKKYFFERSQENTLGKRIAHALITDENPLNAKIAAYSYVARGIEFLNGAEDYRDETLGNSISTNIGMNFIQLFEHSPQKLFMDGEEVDYASIKNLFAMGDQTDKLYQLSNKYYNENIEQGSILKYEDVIARINVNTPPSAELARVMNTLKDYINERTEIFNNPTKYLGENNDQLEENIEVINVMMGAKKYFDDYIEMNEIDLFNLPKKERDNILEFMNDPMTHFFKTHQNNLEMSDQAIERIKNGFKEENARINSEIGNDFINKFNEVNAETDRLNNGKDMATILNDMKGGFFERNFGLSSKEYKALEKSVLAATDKNSPNFGNFQLAKICAIKYIEHKLPEGVKFEDLSENEKRRVEFSRTIINTANIIENVKYDFEEENENDMSISSDNSEFQEQVNKDLNANNQIQVNEIDNQNNVIENEIDVDIK